MRKIILHVGLHKTGSSSIQLTATNNRKLLENNGILYPELDSSNHSISFYSKFSENRDSYHINLKEGLSLCDINKKNEKWFSKLKDEILLSRCETILISGEDISVLSVKELTELKVWFHENIKGVIEFEIIMFAREPINWACSNIQELVKNGIKNIHDAHALGYLQSIDEKQEKFFTVFGESNTHIYSFDKQIKSKEGLIAFFFKRIGIPQKLIDELHVVKTNESLSLEEVFISSLCIDLRNKGVLDVEFDINLTTDFNHTKFSLVHSFSEKIRKEANTDYQLLKQLGEVYEQGNKTHNALDFFSLADVSLIESEFIRLSKLLKSSSIGVADLFRNMALLYEAYSIKRSFQLMQLASKYRPLGPLIKDKINTYIKKLSLEGFFDEDLGFIWIAKSDTKTLFHKKFNDFIYGNEIIKNKILAKSAHHHLPAKVLGEACENKYVSLASPYSGEKIKTTISIKPNIFLFCDHKSILLGVGVEHNMHQAMSDMIVFMAENRIVIRYNYDDSFDYTGTSFSYLARAWLAGLKKELLDITDEKGAYNFPKFLPSKRVIVSSRGLKHMGHALWNSLNAYNNLIDIKYINSREDIELAFIDNFYGTASETKEILYKEKFKFLTFESDNSLLEFASQQNALPIFISSGKLSRNINNKVASFCINNSKASPQPLANEYIIISLRTGLRTCTNQYEIYSSLINQINESYPNKYRFVIDGMNSPRKTRDYHTSAYKRATIDFDTEVELGKKLEALSNNVTSIVGCQLGTSLAYARASILAISPWGAGLVKYKWLTDCNTFIYGSPETVSDNHIHKRLYDNSIILESKMKTIYFTYDKEPKILNKSVPSRNDNYCIDAKSFIFQVLHVIKEI